MDGQIRHPLLVTECFANPEYCRINTIEQFFEGYNVPSVTFGIDCLFSYYYNLNENSEADKKETGKNNQRKINVFLRISLVNIVWKFNDPCGSNHTRRSAIHGYQKDKCWGL